MSRNSFVVKSRRDSETLIEPSDPSLAAIAVGGEKRSAVRPRNVEWPIVKALFRRGRFDGKAVRASREGKRATHGVNLPRAE